jgi:hypothetical protein
MKTSLIRFTFGLALLALALPMACGDSDDTGDDNSGGASPDAGGPSDRGGGSSTAGAPDGAGGMAGGGIMLPPGLSTEPESVECGAAMCESVELMIPIPTPLYVDVCCADAAADSCGVDTTFLEASGAMFAQKCQAQDQGGDEDEDCPSSADVTVPASPGSSTMFPVEGFKGCCRAETGTCGVLVDEVTAPILGTLAEFNLGCIDAEPFFPGEDPIPCGPGAGGSGGAGSGGAGGETASSGAGGAGGDAGGMGDGSGG